LGKYIKWPQNIPNDYKTYQISTKERNDHKIYQMTAKIPNYHNINQHFWLQGPPKCTKILIFGMEIYHQATLLPKWLLQIHRQYVLVILYIHSTCTFRIDICKGDDLKCIIFFQTYWNNITSLFRANIVPLTDWFFTFITWYN
jgi:hypothetical protein